MVFQKHARIVQDNQSFAIFLGLNACDAAKFAILQSTFKSWTHVGHFTPLIVCNGEFPGDSNDYAMVCDKENIGRFTIPHKGDG